MASLSDSEWMDIKVHKKRHGDGMMLLKAKHRQSLKHKRCMNYKPFLIKRNWFGMLIKEKQLLNAVGVNNTELVESLLKDNVSANVADSQNRSALHIAVSRGYADIVKLLLDFNADLNKRDIIGNTPLHLAACSSNLEIITLLLNRGAKVTSLDLHGRNPLQLAESKLQILKQSWKSGTIEVDRLIHQLQEIVNCMISLSIGGWNRPSTTTSVDDLQLLKLSLNSGEETMVDNQISQLEDQLKGFSFN